jgi:hypothetical protein
MRTALLDPMMVEPHRIIFIFSSAKPFRPSSSTNAEKARDLPKTSASGKFLPEPLPNVRKRFVAAAA